MPDETAVPDDTPVWRYLSLRAVIDTIERQRLRLTRVDTFRDAFEGSVTKQQMEQQDAVLMNVASRQHMYDAIASHFPGMSRPTRTDEDPWALITRLRRARIRSAHASCWSRGQGDARTSGHQQSRPLNYFARNIPLPRARRNSDTIATPSFLSFLSWPRSISAR